MVINSCNVSGSSIDRDSYVRACDMAYVWQPFDSTKTIIFLTKAVRLYIIIQQYSQNNYISYIYPITENSEDRWKSYTHFPPPLTYGMHLPPHTHAPTLFLTASYIIRHFRALTRGRRAQTGRCCLLLPSPLNWQRLDFFSMYSRGKNYLTCPRSNYLWLTTTKSICNVNGSISIIFHEWMYSKMGYT